MNVQDCLDGEMTISQNLHLINREGAFQQIHSLILLI